MRTLIRIIVALVLAFVVTAPAYAEVTEIRVARQPGLVYLPIMILEQEHLLEKEAKKRGLGDIKVTFLVFNSGGAAVDALLSGNADMVTSGATNLLTAWSATKGTPNEVRGVAGNGALPMFLLSRNPNVKTIRDFTDRDRIALPAVKISVQALALQMAAQQAFGPGQQNRLDSLTVSMAHPEAMQALLSGQSEINAHFGSPPFQYQELAKPGMHMVLNNYDVMGGAVTFNLVWTTEKFRSANPKLYDAFVKALDEAEAIINRDKRAAAEAYIRISKDKDTVDNIARMMNDPQIVYTTTPQNVMKYADFMAKTGAIKVKPESWKDLFFPNVHELPGS